MNKIKSRVIGQVASCYECTKEWEDYLNGRARKSAYIHAKKTGHKVLVETTTSIIYNG